MKNQIKKESKMSEVHRIRTKEIRVRVTEEELLIAKHKAAYVHMDMGQYFRRIILDDNIIKVPAEEIMEASKAINAYRLEISGISRNLNQMIKIVHENNDLYEEEQLREIERLLETITMSYNELTKEMYERLYSFGKKKD